MGGGVSYQESLAARLEIMQPTLTQITECLAAEAPQLTDGIADLVVRVPVTPPTLGSCVM
jgi:phosphoserine phosphatase